MRAKWFLALLAFVVVAALTAWTGIDPLAIGVLAQAPAAPAAQVAGGAGASASRGAGRTGRGRGRGGPAASSLDLRPASQPLTIDLFTSKNFYKDRANWLDKRYYRCNDSVRAVRHVEPAAHRHEAAGIGVVGRLQRRPARASRSSAPIRTRRRRNTTTR